MSSPWIAVGVATGRLEGEILRGMLESLGLHVRLSQESVGASVGLGIGPLARVELFVPMEEEPAARAALNDYFSAPPSDADASEEIPDS